jgi:hypothetical protein
MYSGCTRLIEGFPPQMLNDLDISARKKWQELPFKSFRSVHYSEFDFIKDTLPEPLLFG